MFSASVSFNSYVPGDRILHLHDNAGLACVPKALADSPTYVGPGACKVRYLCGARVRTSPSIAYVSAYAGCHDRPSLEASDHGPPGPAVNDATASSPACRQDEQFCPAGCCLAVHKGEGRRRVEEEKGGRFSSV
jgi:hypothetical protein